MFTFKIIIFKGILKKIAQKTSLVVNSSFNVVF